jgi:tetratricopeptide (TPR) repeat protein
LLDFLGDLVKNLAGITTSLTFAFLLLFALLVILRRIRGRKQVLFDPWSDLRPQPDEVLGRSVGEMLLHRLGTIQNIHERSTTQVEISNTFRDIPIFAQGLDKDLELLGSAQLGSTPGAMTALLVFVLKAFPFLSPPTRLRGSIHQYGDRYRLQAVLQNYKRPATGRPATLLWEVETAAAVDTGIPEAIEELAYRIYLDLLRERAFKSWECFREFTIGLGHHISYMDLGRPADDLKAFEHYGAADEMEPQNHVVSYNLGVLIYMRFESGKSNEDALLYFRKALSAPNDRLRARANSAMANALLTRVHRFREGGIADLEEALRLAGQAVGLQPDLAGQSVGLQPDLDAAAKAHAYAHHQLGEWLHSHAAGSAGTTGQLKSAEEHRKKAMAEYNRALELNPDHHVAANNLANLQLEWAKVCDSHRQRQDLLKGAEKAAERALQVSPGFDFAHDNLGNIRVELGDQAGAVLEFQAALRFNPDYPEALNDLALVQMDSRYPAASAEEACKSHVAALSMTAPDSEGRRKKLCAQFVNRARALQLEDALVPGVSRGLVADNRCSCDSFWEAAS